MIKDRQILKRIINSNNSLSMLSYILGAALEAAAIFLIARTYTKPVFGEWALYLTGITILDMIRYGLITPALVKFTAGAPGDEQRAYTGAAWKIGISLVAAYALLIYSVGLIPGNFIDSSGFGLFFRWGPVFALASTTPNISIALAQGKENFKRIVFIRLLNTFLFTLFLIINFFELRLSLDLVCIIQAGFYFAASFFCIIFRWSGISAIPRGTGEFVGKLFNFGKYSMGTTIGSNLLRSTDVLLIGIFLTRVEVALYTIPLRLFEIFTIPIMGFSAVAFPGMTGAHRRNAPGEVKKIFYRNTAFLTLLFIPVVIVLFIFSDRLIPLFGGSQYKNVSAPSAVFRLFLLCAILLPLDRFSGTCLDSINKPQFTFFKVVLMAVANLLGDLIILKYFKSLEGVACITILNVAIGALGGYMFLNRKLDLRLRGFIMGAAESFRSFSGKSNP